MRYVHISHTPGSDLNDFRAVVEELGEGRPDGLLISVVGEADGGLHIVDVWASKADADRFAAERLFPAFQRSGRGPGVDATYVAFETEQIALNGATR